MVIKERLIKLRELMKNEGISAYIIPSTDAHQSEYVGEYWKCRQWISGFTGSAGTVVVTLDKAGLWTDGRYFIQAEKQLLGTGIDLFKMGESGVPSFSEWIRENLKPGEKVAFDGKVFSMAAAEKLKAELSLKNIEVIMNLDFIGQIWKDRPSIPEDKIFIHQVKYTGKSRTDKFNEVRKIMAEKGANYYLLASLDDICWLFNIRGRDIPSNPYVTSYAVVGEEKCYLFVNMKKVDDKAREELEKDGVILKEYNEIFKFLEQLDNEASIIFDSNKVNAYLYNSINTMVKKIDEYNLTTMLKAVKNDVEVENIKMAYIKDGVALVKFFKWLKENVEKQTITEIDAENKAEEFRMQQELFLEPSFATIAGYKEHAAMMHYKANSETTYVLKPEGFFLIDSGAHFLNGTTDITRTVSLGKLTEEEKRDFTLVLKSVIALSTAKFLNGATGSNLDVIARIPLWNCGLDYKCGTGHGVGYCSNVHEEPQRFSQVPNTIKLIKGMTITIEPGIYKEGLHGIRTENTVLVVEDEKTEFGQFMRFETLSFIPIDRRAIVKEMLTIEEVQWINCYHRKVFEVLSPHINEEEVQWLESETAEI
ncbi:aminopeptidase P family protein [Clostridium omnivorum]|uniref:Xaa-Pro aminopeptidase n=1 Tax=Clostridium omnivorum TaxID=1604902 RepID=A0ABQ5N786_9CLOT|nr:aminopeptidase P family protein [Clostridium sp. E14]GLC31052.1 Xaa-Pro aminopeptidase [Clostridium sp. E14]